MHGKGRERAGQGKLEGTIEDAVEGMNVRKRAHGWISLGLGEGKGRVAQGDRRGKLSATDRESWRPEGAGRRKFSGRPQWSASQEKWQSEADIGKGKEAE